eukprot:scaffold29601_cov34-Tisochrysis_lutea.AAC.2
MLDTTAPLVDGKPTQWLVDEESATVGPLLTSCCQRPGQACTSSAQIEVVRPDHPGSDHQRCRTGAWCDNARRWHNQVNDARDGGVATRWRALECDVQTTRATTSSGRPISPAYLQRMAQGRGMGRGLTGEPSSHPPSSPLLACTVSLSSAH